MQISINHAYVHIYIPGKNRNFLLNPISNYYSIIKKSLT